MHTAFSLLGHLRVDDPTTGGHPLHVAWPQIALVAHMILVQHPAIQHIGHCLKTTVWVVRKPADVV